MRNSEGKTPALIDDFIDATMILGKAAEQWLSGEINVEELFDAGQKIDPRVRDTAVPDLESSDLESRVHAQEVRDRLFEADRRFSIACSVAEDMDREAPAAVRAEALRVHLALLSAEQPWLIAATPADPSP